MERMNSVTAMILVAACVALASCGKSDAPTAAGPAPASVPGPSTPAMSAPGSVQAVAGETHESIRLRSIPLMKAMTDIMKTVKDEASAKAAVPQIDALGKSVAELKAQDEKLPPMTDAEETALNNKLRAQATATLDDLDKEHQRIEALDPSVSKIVEDAMDKAMP